LIRRTFAKARKTAVAANAKLLANPLARRLAVSLINNAKIKTNNRSLNGIVGEGKVFLWEHFPSPTALFFRAFFAGTGR
jgi:hypothetical protein